MSRCHGAVATLPMRDAQWWGDWECPCCTFRNFGRNPNCRKCGTMKGAERAALRDDPARTTAASAPARNNSHALILGNALKRCVDEADAAEAERIMKAMLDRNIKPDWQCYSNVIQTHANAGEGERAWQYLQSMCLNGLRPNQEVYDCVLRAYVKKRQVSEAHGVLVAMKHAGCVVESKTYAILLEACAQTKLMKKDAESIFKMMLEDRVVPEDAVMDNLENVVGKRRMQELMVERNMLPASVLVGDACALSGETIPSRSRSSQCESSQSPRRGRKGLFDRPAAPRHSRSRSGARSDDDGQGGPAWRRLFRSRSLSERRRQRGELPGSTSSATSRRRYRERDDSEARRSRGRRGPSRFSS